MIVWSTETEAVTVIVCPFRIVITFAVPLVGAAAAATQPTQNHVYCACREGE